ncbi:winged helix-turn-helix domain-containing protein [uncultured Brevundimonas sp.]|uniref:winged helix-turn-helix domain-containing protein n=1 Tax=uncultured Brevundimonas sp. TaxID=213418 RepID=UPI00345DAA11
MGRHSVFGRLGCHVRQSDTSGLRSCDNPDARDAQVTGEPTVDPAFSHRLRTGVMAYLSTAEAADFIEIALALAVPNNSLSSHLSRLEAAGYIEMRRGFLGRKPRTRVVLTVTGRAAWERYLGALG